MKYSKSSLALFSSYSPYAHVKESEKCFYTHPFSNVNVSASFIAQSSSDGAIFMLAGASSTSNDRITIYDGYTFDPLSIADNQPGKTDYMKDAYMSKNNNFIIIGRDNPDYVQIISVAGLGTIATLGINDAFNDTSSNAVCFSDNNNFAFVARTNERIEIYQTSDWALRSSVLTAFPVSTAIACRFFSNDSKVAVFFTASPHIKIFDVDPVTQALSDNASVSFPALSYAPVRVSISNDGQFLALALNNATSKRLAVYDISNDAWQEKAMTHEGVMVTGKSVAWRGNSEIILGTSVSPGLMVFDIDGNQKDVDTLVKSVVAIAVVGDISQDGGLPAGSGWEITGTLTESLAMDEWQITVMEADSKKIIAQEVVTGASFAIPVFSADAVAVTVAPVFDGVWQTGIPISIGDKYYPTDVATTPYYYQATAGGTTGATEPSWPITDGGTVVDGASTWLRVERLINPVTRSPLIPTVIV